MALCLGFGASAGIDRHKSWRLVITSLKSAFFSFDKKRQSKKPQKKSTELIYSIWFGVHTWPASSRSINQGNEQKNFAYKASFLIQFFPRQATRNIHIKSAPCQAVLFPQSRHHFTDIMVSLVDWGYWGPNTSYISEASAEEQNSFAHPESLKNQKLRKEMREDSENSLWCA